jgi:hypothetical protein
MTRDQFSRDDSPYDICETCGEQAWDWPRCLECGAVDIGYLHDKVKQDIARTLAKKDMAVLDWCAETILNLEARRNDDGSYGVAA